MAFINENNKMLQSINADEYENQKSAKKDIGLSEENLEKMRTQIGSALSKHIKKLMDARRERR